MNIKIIVVKHFFRLSFHFLCFSFPSFTAMILFKLNFIRECMGINKLCSKLPLFEEIRNNSLCVVS